MISTILYYFIVLLFFIFLSSFAVTLIVAIIYKVKFEFVNSKCTSEKRLDGKTALVTGGNTGIGFETALDLAARGAQVVIACRDAIKSAKAIDTIKTLTGNHNIEYFPLDLSKFSSVRAFVAEFDKKYDKLHILVNNAGIGSTDNKLSADGIDFVMQVNYFGPFLLTNLLLDKLIASKPSRIVIVSSVLHLFAKFDVNDITGLKTKLSFFRYANSKLCDVLWTKGLAKRLPEDVIVNCLHPGIVRTEIYNNLPSIIRKAILFGIDLLYKTSKDGAQTVIHLSVSEAVENVSGKYFNECTESQCSRKVYDDLLVERVWQKSVEITS